MLPEKADTKPDRRFKVTITFTGVVDTKTRAEAALLLQAQVDAALADLSSHVEEAIEYLGYIHILPGGKKVVRPYRPPPTGYVAHNLSLTASAMGGGSAITVAILADDRPPSSYKEVEIWGTARELFYRASDFPKKSLILTGKGGGWRPLQDSDVNTDRKPLED